MCIRDRDTNSKLIRDIVQQPQKFINLTDLKRTFRDGNRNNLAESSYGSSQVFTNEGPLVNRGSNPNGIIKLGGCPKYYFSHKHYGYFVDFLRQGYDGRFVGSIQSIRDRVVTEPAIRIRFVEDDFDEENLNFRRFSLIKPKDLDNTAYETFQSSNISLFATSSLPFKEGSAGGITLDVPTNRTYAPEAVEVT